MGSQIVTDSIENQAKNSNKKNEYQKLIGEAKDYKNDELYSSAIEKYKLAISIIKDYDIDSSSAKNAILECEESLRKKNTFETAFALGNYIFAKEGESKYNLALEKFNIAKATGYDDELVKIRIDKVTNKIEKRFVYYKDAGDQAFKIDSKSGFERALDLYKKALILKPEDSYILEQIKKCK